ncbi:MAG: 3-deoxy-manno-octulosonate cytidylyltransferase [Chitinophagaceae bacterium]|nr:MAG: 3-deoxy-manno-octulosonate cytidylyltransferase [Chitinophagaceae bacterium]
MKILGIIPARFASSRFPGKPLIDIAGRSMIQHVYERSRLASSLADVVVATDDERIAQTVRDFGGESITTSTDHQSGTDRCAEVALAIPGYDAVINIQGDEPFIDPEQIDLVAKQLLKSGTQIATLIKKIQDPSQLFDPNTPKVVIRTNGEALYFSRTPIPYQRNYLAEEWLAHHTYYRHIGIYGYATNVLAELTKLPVSLLETTEQLEQLRWLEHGYRIQTAITELETVAVDTPEDLERIKKLYL